MNDWVHIPAGVETAQYGTRWIGSMRRSELRAVCAEVGIEVGPDEPKTEMIRLLMEKVRRDEREQANRGDEADAE